MAVLIEEWELDTERIGKRVLIYDCLESTNSTAASFSNDRNNDGLAVIAYRQTAGRGQYGRMWEGGVQASLLMSIILFPPRQWNRPSILAANAAVAIAEAIQDFVAVEPVIKWPNDLLIDGKKLCGILIEQCAGTIVGIGLNIAQNQTDFIQLGLPEATSLRIVSGLVFKIRTVAEAILKAFDRNYYTLNNGEVNLLQDAWSSRTCLLDRKIFISVRDGTTFTGLLLEMSFARIAVILESGAVKSIVPEEILSLRLE